MARVVSGEPQIASMLGIFRVVCDPLRTYRFNTGRLGSDGALTALRCTLLRRPGLKPEKPLPAEG